VLSGNCHSCLGTLAGLQAEQALGHPRRTGIVWFDAHADFNTPDTTPSGFFDGTALSAATGGSWRTLTSTIPGFRPVDEARVVLVGAGDIDPGVDDLLERSAIVTVTVEDMRDNDGDALGAALEGLRERVD
jgi:arginase